MVYVFLAPGFEMIEALAPVDVLSRAQISTETVGVDKNLVPTSCGIYVQTDRTTENFDFSDAEAIILPGGMPGTLNLEQNSVVQNAIDYAMANGIPVCAICAAPSILGHKGLLHRVEATCYPGFEDALEGAVLSDKHVVCDGNIITARGAGVSLDFGFEIIKKLRGAELAEAIKEQIQCK